MRDEETLEKSFIQETRRQTLEHRGWHLIADKGEQNGLEINRADNEGQTERL